MSAHPEQSGAKPAQVMAALANLPRVLSAATLLHGLGLIDQQPHEIVRAYVKRNPCINEHFGKAFGSADLASAPKEQA